MRALVIDDDDIFCRFICGILQNLGWIVDLASNGQVGWQLAQLVPYDLAVCDIVMPHQDGFETIRLLRQQQPSPFIVAISGGGQLSFQSYLKMALRLGADRALAKPFGRAELESAIAGLEAIGDAQTEDRIGA